MTDIVVADNGQIRKISDIELAEDILKLKNNKEHWAVIDKLLNIWAKKAPDEEQAVRINIGQYKEQLKDKKFGQTAYGKDQERRFQLSFPRSLMIMIRAVYKSDELKMDEEFFNEFAKRYPAFKVAERN